MKARTDGDVGVHASITLAQSLLAEGLVDELCLAVGRVLDPVGPRLFAGLPRVASWSSSRPHRPRAAASGCATNCRIVSNSEIVELMGPRTPVEKRRNDASFELSR